jgi:hypothetical protein
MSSEKNDLLKSQICCSCGKLKEIESFYRNQQYKSGRDAKCKICKFNGSFCKKKPKSHYAPKNEALLMRSVKKEDYCDLFTFFSALGYDLEKDIHLQFCERYDLKPKKRSNKDKSRYSPADCK